MMLKSIFSRGAFGAANVCQYYKHFVYFTHNSTFLDKVALIFCLIGGKFRWLEKCQTFASTKSGLLNLEGGGVQLPEIGR